MIVHCEKWGDRYFHCDELHVIRREEDRALERDLEEELLRMFPGALRDVRLVGQGEE